MNLLQPIQQQWRRAIIGYRFMQLVKAPYGDFTGIGKLAAALNDLENLQKVIEFLSSDPRGKQALSDRPILGMVDLHQLHQLPPGTLGYCYADHMLRNGFTPPPTRGHADNPYEYVGLHLLETHDIWHVVTGCDTDKAGEIKLEAFYVAQIYPSRFWVTMLAKNLLKTALEDIELTGQHMDAFTQGWALGKQAKPLFGMQWNQFWEVPLETLRTQLNLQAHTGLVASPVSVAGLTNV